MHFTCIHGAGPEHDLADGPVREQSVTGWLPSGKACLAMMAIHTPMGRHSSHRPRPRPVWGPHTDDAKGESRNCSDSDDLA